MSRSRLSLDPAGVRWRYQRKQQFYSRLTSRALGQRGHRSSSGLGRVLKPRATAIAVRYRTDAREQTIKHGWYAALRAVLEDSIVVCVNDPRKVTGRKHASPFSSFVLAAEISGLHSIFSFRTIDSVAGITGNVTPALLVNDVARPQAHRVLREEVENPSNGRATNRVLARGGLSSARLLLWNKRSHLSCVDGRADRRCNRAGRFSRDVLR